MTWQRPHRHMPCHRSTYGTQNKECTSPEMALWRLSDHGTVFQLFFLTSFIVYTAALHALILILFYLLISGLGYPGLVVFQQIKHFAHQKQAAGNPTPAASSRRGTNTVLRSL